MVPEIGISGLILILLVALVLFGPKRLPEMGRSLGRGMREFKDSISGKDEERTAELRAASTEKAAGSCASCGTALSEDARFLRATHPSRKPVGCTNSVIDWIRPIYAPRALRAPPDRQPSAKTYSAA